MLLNEVRYPVTFLSVPHIIFISILLPTAIFLAFFLSKKFGFTKKIIWACAIIGMFCELERLLFFVTGNENGYRLPPDFLPFNLCQFQVILIFILAFSENVHKHKLLLSFMYPTLVGGAFMGSIIPAAAIYHGLLEIATYRYFFFHAMLMFFGLYIFLSRPIQYDLTNYAAGLFLTFVSMIFAIWLNAFFGWDPGVNHMFVVRPPIDGLPILNFENGWLRYMVDMLWVGLLLITLCYLPVIIREAPKQIKQIINKK